MNKPQQDNNMAGYNRLMVGGDCELVKEPLNGVKARNAESSFVFLREISDETITQINQTTCTDLEHIDEQVRIPAMAIERLVAICADPVLMARLGASLPLLVIIVLACGSSNGCTITYPEIAMKCGVSAGTIKNWTKSLVSAGLISKTMHGQDGIKVVLNLEIIKRLPVFEHIVKYIKNSVDLLNAGKSAMQSAACELAGGLEAAQ